MISGQGEMKQTEFGSKRESNEGRGRFDLIPYEAMEALAKWYEEGAKKYDERNWEKGISVKDCINRMIRHALKVGSGFTDEDHLAAVMWNAAAAITMMQRYPECNDHIWQTKEEGGGILFADAKPCAVVDGKGNTTIIPKDLKESVIALYRTNRFSNVQIAQMMNTPIEHVRSFVNAYLESTVIPHQNKEDQTALNQQPTVTYEDIYNQFKKTSGIKTSLISDYKPCNRSTGGVYIPNAIVVYLNTGKSFVYIWGGVMKDLPL